jgi:predicted lipoprotein with Yx(FWY)xxD motif
MEQANQHRGSIHRVPVGRIAVAAFAIGGLSASTFAVDTAGATSSRTTNRVIVSTIQNKLGRILVSGKTLYTLKASKTPCGVQCVKVWPELLLPKGVTKATAGTGVTASKLGTVARAGGVRQVTYSGKALYWYSLDTGPRQVNGNLTDSWGKWTAFVTAKPATSGSGSGAGSGRSTSGSGGIAF